MAEALKPTAWGNSILEFGTPGAGDTMATALTQVGYIKEETLTLELEDGTELSLYEEGHVLRDRMQQEGTVKVSGTLIGIPDTARTAFWKTEEEGVGDAKKVHVKSMVSNEKFSVKISVPDAPGSETLEVPYSSVNLGMAYASNEGWTAPFSFTIVKGATGNLFDFGIVPTTPQG